MAQNEPRWTYKKAKTASGAYLGYDLTVLLNGDPVGTVLLDTSKGQPGVWNWHVRMTQDHGHKPNRDEALNAVRDSILKSLAEPF